VVELERVQLVVGVEAILEAVDGMKMKNENLFYKASVP
jgi:hypothetical protein